MDQELEVKSQRINYTYLTENEISEDCEQIKKEIRILDLRYVGDPKEPREYFHC